MPDIVLATLNAKFIHAAFGLRYVFANLGELQSRAVMAEFDINQRPLDIAEVLLARDPKILGLGVYIWNVTETTEVVAAIKRVRPEIKIILGGPEVSYETESQEIVRLADHVITGEGDLKFAEVCRVILARCSPTAHESQNGGTKHLSPALSPFCSADSAKRGEGESVYVTLQRDKTLPASRQNPAPGGSGAEYANHPEKLLPKIIAAELPDFSRIALPYQFYNEADIAHRVVYVEASRGCPFTCEFCLSSLDIPVRAVPLAQFLGEMQKLLDRGLKQFKFVDRTFNLNIGTSKAILEFFLARHQPGNFYHFEMIPDRLPAELREVIARFPPGVLQFEVGIQTFNPEVGHNISRRQNYERLADNFHFLRNQTRVHIHADLIVGLPGETVKSFGAGFDKLIAMGPQEIQVGILKRLRGTPIVRHDAEWQMIYNPQPPYEILQNKLIDFATLQRLRRFAKYWDLVGNSGNFTGTTPLLWVVAQASCLCDSEAGEKRTGKMPVPLASPFANFLRFSDWLYGRIARTDSIALARLAELLFEFLTNELNLDAGSVAETMAKDWLRGGRRDVPEFLRKFLPVEIQVRVREGKSSLPKRQARHFGG